MDLISGNYNSSISSSPSISSSSSSKKCLPSADSRRTSSACIFPKPPWLVSTLQDLEGRMKILSLIRNIDKEKDEINIVEEEEAEAENTFADRAEIYYLKRPQLLNLLHDLYNNYLSLSDRYCQTITKINRQTNDYDSDMESSLSHQSSSLDMDIIMAELVMKMVENDMIVQELNITEKKWGESIRKTEIQTSLLEVLESERQILLSENSRLCVRANTMASEANHRMYMLSRRIEDLQEQIRNLQGQFTNGDRLMVMINHHQYHHDESPNYYQKGLGLGWKMENEKMSSMFPDYEGTASTSCSSSSNIGMINGGKKKRIMRKKREIGGSWWNRFKNFEILLCGIHDDST